MTGGEREKKPNETKTMLGKYLRPYGVRPSVRVSLVANLQNEHYSICHFATMSQCHRIVHICYGGTLPAAAAAASDFLR